MKREVILREKNMVYDNIGRLRLLGVVEYLGNTKYEVLGKGDCNIVVLSPEQYGKLKLGDKITVYSYHPKRERAFPFELPDTRCRECW